jgi:hypothetical protein
MREPQLDPEVRKTYRAGLWCTVGYLALVIAFVTLDAIFAFTRPSGFAHSMAGILAPIAAVWGVMAARSPD